MAGGGAERTLGILPGCKDKVVVSPVFERIALAQGYFERWGAALGDEPSVAGRLRTLEQKVAATQRAMRELGVSSACRYCEEEGGGSCCGEGIETKYSTSLILLNLILGVSLPGRRTVENGCFFLGPKGCVLIARHVLCVNYLCTRIVGQLEPEAHCRLQTIAGDELDATFLLHETIVKITNRG